MDEIYPVLRDLTQSFRKGDWLLHCSAVRRSIQLFFGFDRPNYKRWVPLYLEDCLSVQTKYPELSKHFIDGGFVGSQTSRCGSSLPFDQLLEKAYNKPAKVSGGIIGMTRRKENVTKWELNKHEKDQYIDFMSSVLGISDDDDEFSVHYEFSPSVTSEDYACVNLIINWVLEHHKNPFNVESSCLKHKNIFTGESCPPLLTTYLL